MIVDPSWNPAHDLQAQDRAFRIGQRRDVGVYRLVSTGAASHHLPTVSPHTYACTHACRLTSLTHCLSTHTHTYACMHVCTCLHACTHERADGQVDEQPRTLHRPVHPSIQADIWWQQPTSAMHHWTHTSLQHREHAHFSSAAGVAYMSGCICCYMLA